jgi:hypothetical protein
VELKIASIPITQIVQKTLFFMCESIRQAS